MAQNVVIYRPGTPDMLVVAIEPDNNSVQEKAVMGVNEIRLSFVMNHYQEFKIGDYCDLFVARYTLNSLPVFTKLSTYRYQYSMTMESFASDLKKVQYLFLGPDNTLKETDFSLIGKATDFINLMINNMTRAGYTGWTLGEATPSDYLNLTFSQSTCFESLQQIADAFEVEWWVVDKIIYLVNRRVETGEVYQHGIHKGAYEVSRLNLNGANVITRLIVFGSDKNLPEGYRAYASQHLLMTGGIRALEKNIDLYGVREGVKVFDDVYPHRTGIVTGVDSGNVFSFTDTNIDFDVNAYLLPGLVAKVTFNTGQLTGYTFQISSFDNGTKEFVFLKNDEEKNLDVPSVLFKPAIGDEYVLTDITMPTSYVDYAEAYLQAAAQIYLDKVAAPQVVYQMVVDPLYLKARAQHPDIGQNVFIVDPDIGFNRKIPIMNIIRNVVKEWEYTITLADKVDRNPLDDVINITRNQDRRIRDLAKMLASRGPFVGRLVVPHVTDTTGLLHTYVDPVTGRVFLGP